MNKVENMNEKSNAGIIRPIGERVCPDWLEYEFDDFEEFYKHYCKLLGVGD
jgi:hypothetical protein